MGMNVVHFYTDRLTPLGWALFTASWASLAGLFILGFVGAPRVFIVIDVCVYFVTMASTAILDYAGNAVHRLRPRPEDSASSAVEGPQSREDGGGV